MSEASETTSVDMTQDGPLVDGWEIWRIDDEVEREVFWLLVRPGESVGDAMRKSDHWDLTDPETSARLIDGVAARRWTLHESLHFRVRVENHPHINMTLREAAEQQASDAAAHDPDRLIASTCW